MSDLTRESALFVSCQIIGGILAMENLAHRRRQSRQEQHQMHDPFSWSSSCVKNRGKSPHDLHEDSIMDIGIGPYEPKE